jgi:uncharacterized membrane protein YfcA
VTNDELWLSTALFLIALLYAAAGQAGASLAFRCFIRPWGSAFRLRVPPAVPPFLPALLTGAAIGFISGTTGTGGGIFLAPIILLMNWVDIRKVAAVTAAFNLLNSGAALIGAYATLGHLPASPAPGAIGAIIGARYLPEQGLRYLLAAGVNLIL